MSYVKSWLIEGNGYETRQSSLLYVFVLFFGLDRAQNTLVVYLSTDRGTNQQKCFDYLALPYTIQYSINRS